jgi:hypothetical protein
MTLTEILHDGSLWFLLVCLLLIAGVVIGLFTRSGSGIDSHPYGKTSGADELASDLPSESIGRVELEPLLWRKRPRHHRPRPHRRGE